MGLRTRKLHTLTRLAKNPVKATDLHRLKERYSIDGTLLINPEIQTQILGIDEFKLHDGHQYDMVIINMERGHILWLAHG